MLEGEKDFQTLMQHLVRQAIDDYIRLRHPLLRTKKHLNEAWQSAVEFFFDPEYQNDILKNEKGESATLIDILKWAADRENLNLEQLKSYLVAQAKIYWAEKQIKAFEIPLYINLMGHTLAVIKDTKAKLSWNENTISLDETTHKSQEQQLIYMALKAMLKENNIILPASKVKTLSEQIHDFLLMNNCFR